MVFSVSTAVSQHPYQENFEYLREVFENLADVPRGWQIPYSVLLSNLSRKDKHSLVYYTRKRFCELLPNVIPIDLQPPITSVSVEQIISDTTGKYYLEIHFANISHKWIISFYFDKFFILKDFSRLYVYTPPIPIIVQLPPVSYGVTRRRQVIYKPKGQPVPAILPISPPLSPLPPTARQHVTYTRRPVQG